eukprot:scaffold250610_cov30-Tisochrysis_lutea.AAC.22
MLIFVSAPRVSKCMRTGPARDCAAPERRGTRCCPSSHTDISGSRVPALESAVLDKTYSFSSNVASLKAESMTVSDISVASCRAERARPRRPETAGREDARLLDAVAPEVRRKRGTCEVICCRTKAKALSTAGSKLGQAASLKIEVVQLRLCVFVETPYVERLDVALEVRGALPSARVERSALSRLPCHTSQRVIYMQLSRLDGACGVAFNARVSKPFSFVTGAAAVAADSATPILSPSCASTIDLIRPAA